MRLVHLSDLHLGFRAYLQIEQGWNQRERDLAASFRWALQETVRLKPDLVLITGDLFDHPNPPSTAFLTIHRGVSRLRTYLPGIPILIIAGERDSPINPADPGPVAVLDALPGVEAAVGAPRAVRFRSTKLHALLIPFRAAAYPPMPDVRPDPAARWNVLLVRGDPSDSRPGIPVNPDEWSYVAVGGDHQRRAWAPNVQTAGALERPGSCPWREATEEKGFLSFDLEDGSAEFHPVPGRPVVDLAPVRVAREDPQPGTRRLRELLQGVPGGIERKIVRVRLRGDIITPDEGVSQGLLDAVRRRAAHLEVHAESNEADSMQRMSSLAWAAEEIVWSGTSPVRVSESGKFPEITLLTSASESFRIEMVDALRRNRKVRGSGMPLLRKLRISPSPPDDPVSAGLWAGGLDPEFLLRTVLAGFREDSISEPDQESSLSRGTLDREVLAGETEEESLLSMEVGLTDRRADWVEASADLEAATLQWGQERQDAESKLRAYRDRAGELRFRIRALESDKESASCPTCGRTLGAGFGSLLETLHGEWEDVVQDGRWWKRRRGQLDKKPEELRELEEQALRLQVRVEEATKVLEGRRERRRGYGVERSNQSAVAEDVFTPVPPAFDSAEDLALREVLRLAGSLLSQITEGLIIGVRVDPELQVVSSDGQQREPVGIEHAALRLAIHLALWLHSRSKTTQTNSLLVWELHEAGTEELCRGALEVLSDAERFNVPVVLVAPPSVWERLPEVFYQVLELVVDEQGRQEFRRLECGRPGVRLLG